MIRNDYLCKHCPHEANHHLIETANGTCTYYYGEGRSVDSLYCSCVHFEPDNLKYLEKQYEKRETLQKLSADKA